MTKLAIIDLDGVIADSTARFAKAEEAKQTFLAGLQGDIQARMHNVLSSTYKPPREQATNIYWQTALDPSLVPLDTLIPGTLEALDVLYGEYGVLFLTSRPETMRAATEEWLYQHNIIVEHPAFGSSLVMKSPAFQYTKTTVWKAGIIHTLTALYAASEVLVIDDEQANIDELHKYGFEDSVKLRCSTSLAESIR
jgi:ribonucleotide monophosphatase NagD (HAD superfamily)